MALSCIIPKASKNLAKKVVDTFSKEQLEKYNIVTDENKEDAVTAIQALIERHIGAQEDESKRDQMLGGATAAEDFLNDFEKFFAVRQVSKEDMESAKKQYEEVSKVLEERGLSRIGTYQVEDTKEQQDFISNFKGWLESNNVHVMTSLYDNGHIQTCSWVVAEPQEMKDTPQQKTLDTIANIQGIESKYVRPEIGAHGKRTGRSIYAYNGREILVESVSHDVYGDTEYDGPVLASPIGNNVDTVGRLAFDKTSKLWDKEGKLVDDTSLQDIIDNDLQGIFTVQGLKNLIKDFQTLEKELRDKWGNDIQIFSGDLKLFAKQSDSSIWIHGKPDLLVIDNKGVVHVLDFKTSKINGKLNYNSNLNKDKGTNYGKQITRYIRLLESYGLQVDNNPYVVLVDTWYNSSDTIKSRKDGQKAVYDIPTDFRDSISLTAENQTLGEYSEDMGNPSREEVLGDDGVDILYMEPRLHVKWEEGKGFSEELAALRDEDVPLDEEVAPYEVQYTALSAQEKEALKWLNPASGHSTPAQGIVKLSSNDIESNPDLISAQEIHDLANMVMWGVSQYITMLQKGEKTSDFPITNPNNENLPSPLTGRSREEIIRLVGLDALLDLGMRMVTARIDDELPSREQYDAGKDENGRYEDEWYEFENEQDYQNYVEWDKKARWIKDHKEQFLMAGAAKLITLEDSIIPVKAESESFNPTAPSVRPEVSDVEVRKNLGDNESLESFVDAYLEGLTDAEAWMMGQRNYSPKASLAREVRALFEDLILTDADGKRIRDPYGWGFAQPVDITYAIQTVMDTCHDCETMQDMMDALKTLSNTSSYNWITQLLDKLNAPGRENLKKKFFRHFRKDEMHYSIAKARYDKESGEYVVETRLVNRKSAYQTMLDSLGATFKQGLVGKFTFVSGNKSSLIQSAGTDYNRLTPFKGNPDKSLAQVLLTRTKAMQDQLKELYRKPIEGKNEVESMLYHLQHTPLKRGRTMIEETTNLLHSIGILVPQAVVEKYVTQKIGKNSRSSNTYLLLNKIRNVLSSLIVQQDKQGHLPKGLTGLYAFKYYQPLVATLSDYVQETVEASVYQDGKTYYSYTNPSKLGQIIRNLKSIRVQKEDGKYKWNDFCKTNFLRYNGWYVDTAGEGYILCDWLDQIIDQFDDEEDGVYLDHKVELSFQGTAYRDLDPLNFQLSILHNYFGSREDREMNEDLRWFALPTMSNKPTNEFVRMPKYGSKEQIINRVLVPTFTQEMNRIADVLYHYTHHSIGNDMMDLSDKKLLAAGWEKEEIQDLKDRIDNQKVTMQDLQRLSSITSGAKFHFLWYLNQEMARNPEFSVAIADRINLLLTPDTAEKQANIVASKEADTDKMVRDTIEEWMEAIVLDEFAKMEDMGLLETEMRKVKDKTMEVPKYQGEFNGLMGSTQYGNAVREWENALKNFIWEDIAANINIIQLTGGDLAYYGNAVNYQKRIAQIHSPGVAIVHDENYDDGYLRSVHISDEKVRDEILYNTEVALTQYMDKMNLAGTTREDYKKMITIILSGLTEALNTDGQSYSSPSSKRKKLALQGEWDETKEEAYQRISKGDFNINLLGILLQPDKPFVTADLAKYSGSPTMTLRRVPLQDKNSEYLIILAEALARGAEGKRNKLAAIADFMEATHKSGDGKHGIDTVHFESVNKVGKSGIIDIAAFDMQFDEQVKKGEVEEKDYNKLLTEYMLGKVRRETTDAETQAVFDAEDDLVKQGKLKQQEAYYNNLYVDTIPVSAYIIQQEVPAHLLEHQQLYGSQIRILGISDITPGTTFKVADKEMTDTDLVTEYKNLHAQNIEESYKDLMMELGLDTLVKDNTLDFSSIMELPVGDETRNKVLKNLETLLQKELSKDVKYGLDIRRACSLQKDAEGNYIDFNIPLMDPCQTNRIQMLVNSIVKKTINKQRINGGPVVQTTAYDNDLHIVFQDKNGNQLPTLKESGMSVAEYRKYLKENQAGIKYFECYMPVPNAQLERLMVNPDGSMISIEQVAKLMGEENWKAMSQVIGYRIPTEDKYSMLPLKIKGFVPKAAGQVIMMPQEITYLTGSDFDIDKMYLMLKSFDTKIAGPSQQNIEAIVSKYHKDTEQLSLPNMDRIAGKVIDNGNRILSGERVSWSTGIESDVLNKYRKEIDEFIGWYRNYLLQEGFIEYSGTAALTRKEQREARNNRILDLQWAVLTNQDTSAKMLNPGNFNDLKKVGRVISVLKNQKDTILERPFSYEELMQKSVKELDALLENTDSHNTTLPSSKIYFQHQNMQGTQMTGIFANNTVSHAFMTFQKVGIDLKNNAFEFGGIRIGDSSNPTVLDPMVGHDGKLISKVIASFLAAAVDTAKDPVLANLNINTFTGGTAMLLARLGFDVPIIGLFLSQPVIQQVTDLYFKHRLDKSYTGEAAILEIANSLGMDKQTVSDTTGVNNGELTVENFLEHLNDSLEDDDTEFQKRVLKGFYRLYNTSKDLQELTYCTKFNSVNNAVGPTIADTAVKKNRVEKFIEEMEDTAFYIPQKDKDDFTDPRDIIANDPILKAFYESTIGEKGASEQIFKNFFPHYYAGFQNVKQYVQDNILGKKKMTSKLYNQILNAYLYYMLTYQDENIRPTIPYSEYHKERLVTGLVNDYREILDIENRRPNTILDQNLGNSCLYIRAADKFVAIDTLLFNSSQQDNDTRERILNAWSDLLTMNDSHLTQTENEKIRNFGKNLFFYSLMRNGFNFSPKTLMHLASTIVKYNATYEVGFSNYVTGLRNLKTIDETLFDIDPSSSYFKRFCNQFIRNNMQNTSIVPKVSPANVEATFEHGILEFDFNDKNKDKQSSLVGLNAQNTDNPYTYINILKTKDSTVPAGLYEVLETADEKVSRNGEGIVVKYRKISPLGMTDNFIEYDANSDIETSFFEGIRNNSEEELEAVTVSQEQDEDDYEFRRPSSTQTVQDRTSMKNRMAGRVGTDSDNNTSVEKQVDKKMDEQDKC